jgi:hypothetical protein
VNAVTTTPSSATCVIRPSDQPRDVTKFIEGTLLYSKHSGRLALGLRHSRMVKPMASFLDSLGITPHRWHPYLEGTVDLEEQSYSCAGFKLTAHELRQDMNNVLISYIQGVLSNDDVHRHNFGPREWTTQESGKAHSMAVTGLTWIVADENGAPLHRSMRSSPICCVSTPEINLGYSDADRAEFGAPFPKAKELWTLTRAGVEQLKRIWHHVLYMFAYCEVQYAVLYALGSGPSAHGTPENLVQTKSAQALVHVLLRQDYGNTFECIFVAFENPMDMDAFRKVISKHAQALVERGITIALTHGHRVTALARSLSEGGVVVGILNPSSPRAVREGTIGMNWYNEKRVDREEVMAVQTTVLLQHIVVNPDAWNGKRTNLVAVPDFIKT